MTRFITDEPVSEHSCCLPIEEDCQENLCSVPFNGNSNCVEVTDSEGKKVIETSYYIGTDWVTEDKGYAIQVVPKLNEEGKEVDYLGMFLIGLSHPEVLQHAKELYRIKFDEPSIDITSQRDHLTPLLIVHLLGIVKSIVRKGIKKSYYRRTENLDSRIKGKILIAPTLKKNILQGKQTKTYCRYDEFGINCLENRLLKKTLLFIQRYLASFNPSKEISQIFSYCLSAFDLVDETVELHQIKHFKHNSFYREYNEAIRVAQLILRRFAYNIKNTVKEIPTPPFWIDMAKLFELYVLVLLKNKYGGKIKFQPQGNYGQPDFLYTGEPKLIIDTKYKKVYQKEKYDIDDIHKFIADIRQLSGYARDKGVLGKLSVTEENTVVPCLIIYPDQKEGSPYDLCGIDNLSGLSKINGFTEFYKKPVQLPEIG